MADKSKKNQARKIAPANSTGSAMFAEAGGVQEAQAVVPTTAEAEATEGDGETTEPDTTGDNDVPAGGSGADDSADAETPETPETPETTETVDGSDTVETPATTESDDAFISPFEPKVSEAQESTAVKPFEGYRVGSCKNCGPSADVLGRAVVEDGVYRGDTYACGECGAESSNYFDLVS